MKSQLIIATLVTLAAIAVYYGAEENPQKATQLRTEGAETTHSTVSALPPKIVAGEVHYSRIPVEYWEHRLQMIKSMGFNALSVYIMWNYHEVEKGKFDYETGNKNLTFFLQLAKKYDFYVLIRPGPYVCAEWDFGGFPARLLNVDGIKLRANNAVYLNEVKQYFQSLVPVLEPFWSKNGGPIVLLQIENEYGFYGNDKTYIQALRTMWHNLGVQSEEYYVDTAANLQKCHWSGANIGINDGITEEQYSFAKTFQKTGMIFGGEIYSGWLTHWGEAFQGKTLAKYNSEFNFLFTKNHSFSMYMVHGGSNFGLTAGANAYSGNSDYKGHITSYDYDAPIDEQGSPNAKFTSFRDMAKKFVPWTIPEPPQPIKTIQIPAFRPLRIANLYANLPAPTFERSPTPYLFESNQLKMYNQGFVVYETILTKDVHYLSLIVRDFAIVYVNANYFAYLDRASSSKHNLTVNCTTTDCTLTIIVEAMGHINFDHQMETDKKGLYFFNDTRSTKFEWNIYKMNVDENIPKWKVLAGTITFPSLQRGSFALTEVGDTFINLKNYKKGYVWVNGKNLGRYWNVGPTQKLFCPGVWLKNGQNEIHILELLTDATGDITGDKTLK